MSRTPITTRAFPPNSPQAAGRLLGLALIANGEIKAKEWAVLNALEACTQLGLDEDTWQDLLEALYLDVLAPTEGTGCEVVDEVMLSRWLAEVDDPALQRRLLHLCARVSEADGHVDPGESQVLRRMLEQWVLPAQEQAEVEPLLYGLDFQVRPRRTQPAAA